MKKLLVCVLTILAVSGCGSKSAPPPQQESKPHQKMAALFEKINVGDSREQVQKLLGAPFMMQKAADGETAMYMSGMEGMNAAMRAQMRTAQAGSAASSILGAATGLLGIAGPGGALAGGIANEALSAGMGLASEGAAMEMPDPSEIEMLMVTYQAGKVSRLQRMNMGAMGDGVDPNAAADDS